MGFISYESLETMYRSGRFRPEPTIEFVEAYVFSPETPPEAILLDRRIDVFGECWQADLEMLLEIAKRESDNERINPNLSVLTLAYNELVFLRKEAPRLQEAVREARASTVVPFTRQPS